MANTRSSKKDIRKTKTRTALNRVKKDAIRAARKKFQNAITAGNAEEAKAAIPGYMKALDKAAKRNTIHKNKASRLKSRISAVYRKLAGGAAKAN